MLTNGTPHVAADDWRLSRPQIYALVENYVAYVHTAALSCFDLACLRPVAPATYRVTVDPERDAHHVEPFPRPPRALVRLALIELWGSAIAACFVEDWSALVADWSILLVVWAVIVAATFGAVVGIAVAGHRRRSALRGPAEIPAPVRAFLRATRLRTIAQKEELMGAYKPGITVFFKLFGGALVHGVVAERAAEFAEKLAEAATEGAVEKLVSPALERANAALRAAVDDWLAQTYAVPRPTPIARLSPAELKKIDLRRPVAKRG